jgi:DNA-binding CsgD family transcriptional regulator
MCAPRRGSSSTSAGSSLPFEHGLPRWAWLAQGRRGAVGAGCRRTFGARADGHAVTRRPGDDAAGAQALIGREAEHAAASVFLDAVARGPMALVLSGPVGIGKTTIWRALLDDARRRGYRTMATRAVEAEAQLAFAGLADLLDPSVDEVLDGLPPAQRAALEVALQRIPVGQIPPPPLAVSLGALASIRALAESSPVIVAVDDLAWLDGPSARVLDYAVRRLDGVRIGLVVTVRADLVDPPLPPVVADFPGSVELLHVGPLDLNAIDALVRRELGLSLRRPALAWVHAESGGNPFVALEVARAMRRAGFQPGLEGLAIPTATSDLVRQRLDALPASTRRPLAALAALGRPSVELLASAIPGAGDALEAARLGGVIELDANRVRFTHPLLAAGAYAFLDEAERRALHARLAKTVIEPEQRARHLALSTDAASEAVAAELDRAASHARSRGGSDAAAELALQAARRTPVDDPAAVQRRIVAAGGYLIQAGDPTRARAVLEDYVAATRPGPLRADALRMLADARSSDDWQAKIRLLEEALDEAGEDHRLRGEILQALSQTKWHTARDARGEVALAMAAVAEAESQDDPVARCSAYLAAVFARLSGGQGLAVELLERAEALAPLVEHQRVFLWPAFCRALTDVQCDRLDPAIETLQELRGWAAAVGDWDSMPLISSNLAEATFRRGAWSDAHGHAREAERGSRQNGQAEGLSFALSVRAAIEIGLGQEDDGRRAAEEGMALAREVGGRASELSNRAALGFLALSVGDVQVAAAELGQAVAPWLAEGYLDPAVLVSLPDWAEALVALDQVAEAAALLDPYQEAARRLDRPSALAASLRVRGLIAAVRGEEKAAEEAFRSALGHHDRIQEPFQRGRTLLAQGEAFRRLRRRGQAREALGAAVAIFEELGARRWQERAAAELARTGHRETGSSFTATELQVARLVAAGKTNREVAETLFMSVHTVEAHLTRIYRSLGVRGRTELVRAIAARLPDGADAVGATENEGSG